MDKTLLLVGVALLGVDALIIKWVLGMMFISLETGSIISILLGSVILYFGGFAVILFAGIFGVLCLWHGICD